MDIRDSHDQLLPIDPISNQNIAELRAEQPTSVLMVSLAIIISSAFLFLSVCVGGLVFVKIRTDRLIKAHNENMQTMDITETVPINVMSINDEFYGNESSFSDATDNRSLRNFDIRNPNYFRRVRQTSELHHNHHEVIITRNNVSPNTVDNRATDTVIFSRHPFVTNK